MRNKNEKPVISCEKKQKASKSEHTERIKKLFTPVKVTDSKWAEKLLDGEVFMRPIREFGSWTHLENLNDPVLNNSARGDIYEGTSAVFASAEDSLLMKGFDTDARSSFKKISYIDQGDVQFRVRCFN